MLASADATHEFERHSELSVHSPPEIFFASQTLLELQNMFPGQGVAILHVTPTKESTRVPEQPLLGFNHKSNPTEIKVAAAISVLFVEELN